MPAICKILLMSVLAVCTLMDVRSHTVSLPVILGGDMNSVPGSLAHDVFARNGFVTAADAADVRSEHRSYHLNPVDEFGVR